MSKLIVGINDLATTHPELVKEWHPTKNEGLTPADVTAGSKKKVWWLLPYDDPETGKHFDFEWEAVICSRTTRKCPYLSGRAVWNGFNDLATANPKLAKEWHPTKNGTLKPTDITVNSNKEVWWLLPYDDHKTGRHFNFEWKTTVNSRTSGKACPYLSGHAVWSGFNDLATTNPELAKEWHPTKNGNLKPTDITAGSHKIVWWLFPYDDTKTGKHFDFEWEAEIKSRANEIRCPYLSNPAKAICKGFNDLTTTHPKLAKEWHSIKNGSLTPSDVTAGSEKRVWWLLPYDDPKTGKHFNFEWDATINSRATQNQNCPFLSGKRVWIGFNDLATTNPELAKEWHPTKNGNLKPTDVTVSSGKKVWWLLPYDDQKTGKHFDFEWEAQIDHRTIKNLGCPYLSGRAVWSGFNDLATTNPELAKEWHPTKNGALKPTDITAQSNKKVWWLLPYDDTKTGKHFDFEWESTIYHRSNGRGCPYLSFSRGESLILNILNNNKIYFEQEKTFSILTNITKLRFDFYINNSIAIEYDGIQHFKLIDYFGGEPALKDTVNRDNIKNQFCYDNDIPLLRIPYTYDPVADKEKIETIVLDFVKTHTISQEILNFYKKQKNDNYYKMFSQKQLKKVM